MKQYLSALILLLGGYLSATTVTGTIQDINGNRYANGTVSAFNLITGASMTPGATDANGSFSITLSPSTYLFTVCARPVNIGPSTSTSVTQVCSQPATPIIISGGSQDVSTQINAVAPILGPSVAALLAANNAFTGNNTHAGTETFSGLTYITNLLLKGSPAVDIKAFGAKGDMQQEGGDNENTGHGQCVASSTAYVNNSANFSSSDVGKLFVAYGCGALWPSRQISTAYATGALVYQRVTMNGIPNVAVTLYARVGGTTAGGALTVPSQWSGLPGLVLHSGGEVVDGSVTWDEVGSAPLAFANSFTTALPLITTIAGFTDSHHITLAAAAVTTFATAKTQWATDDTAAINAANSFACNQISGTSGLTTYNNYVVVYPRGGYGISSTIAMPNCAPESGATIASELNNGGGQQAGSYLWNTSPNTDGLQYTLNTIGFVDHGVGVISLGGGYGIGSGITLGTTNTTIFEPTIEGAWVANNGGVNINIVNARYPVVEDVNVGGSMAGIFFNGGQAGGGQPCNQSNQGYFGPGIKFFASLGPDLLYLNVKWSKAQGDTYGPALAGRLADSTLGAVQIEADTACNNGTGSGTYDDTFDGTFNQNGNDYYITGPAGYHPSGLTIMGTTANAYQSPVVVAGGDNLNIGPLNVQNSAQCFISATNCTNVSSLSVVNILGTSANNHVHDIKNSYVVNPPYNPNYILHAASTTTGTTWSALSGQSVLASIGIDSGATAGSIDSGPTNVWNDQLKATAANRDTLVLRSSDASTNALQLKFTMVGNTTSATRGWSIQSVEPGVTNNFLEILPNAPGSSGAVSIAGGARAPTETLDISGSLGLVEQAGPAATAAVDVCYGDSTAHWLECSMNGGTFGKIVLENATETLTGKTLTSPLLSGGAVGTAAALSLGYDSTTGTEQHNSNNSGASSFTGAWNCVNVTPVTVNTSTTADQNVMACTIPAGTLNRTGRTLRIATSGIYSTPAASTAQMTAKIKLCTISGCGSGTVLTLVSIQSTALGTVQITNDNWGFNALATTQTAGATASFESHGDLLIDLSTLTTAADSAFGDTNTATIGTIDTTAQLFLQIAFAFSAASASNTSTERQLTVETIN